jgi:hypothetical protein
MGNWLARTRSDSNCLPRNSFSGAKTMASPTRPFFSAHEARPLGFKYLVNEAGPLSTRMIAHTLSRDGIAGLHQLVREVPLGIPFISLKDDAELATDFLGQDEKGNPYLWRIDQEFIGSPPTAKRPILSPRFSLKWGSSTSRSAPTRSTPSISAPSPLPRLAILLAYSAMETFAPALSGESTRTVIKCGCDAAQDCASRLLSK